MSSMNDKPTPPSLVATLLDFPLQLALSLAGGAVIAAALSLVLAHGPNAVAWLRHVVSA